MKLHYNFDELIKFTENISYEIDSALMTAARRIAKELHKHLVSQTPVKTGNLRKMWSAGDNLMFTVNKVGNRYEVVLINKAEYAAWVNDGHYSYNQYNVGGNPYLVVNRTVLYTRGNKDETFVCGRFFVEDSIDLTYPKVERIVMAELKKHLGGVYT